MVYLGETTDAAAMYYARRARASQLTKKKADKRKREKKKSEVEHRFLKSELECRSLARCNW